MSGDRRRQSDRRRHPGAPPPGEAALSDGTLDDVERHRGDHHRRRCFDPEQRVAAETRPGMIEIHEQGPVPEIHAVGDAPEVAQRRHRQAPCQERAPDADHAGEHAHGGERSQQEAPVVGQGVVEVDEGPQQGAARHPEQPDGEEDPPSGGGSGRPLQFSAPGRAVGRTVRRHLPHPGPSVRPQREHHGQGGAHQERLGAGVGSVVHAVAVRR